MRISSGTDAALLARLHAKGFDHGWPEADFTAHIENPLDEILCAEIDGVIAGFILARTTSDQSEILTITVDPQFRKQGLADQLLTACEAAIIQRGADILFLEVAADNPAAIALYRKHSYAHYGSRPGYYRRNDGRVAALLFQKRLSQFPMRVALYPNPVLP